MPSTPLQFCQTPSCGNLVAYGTCLTCRTATLNDTNITVVTGAPCSGKTTYVNRHKRAGDLVVDLDALKIALGSDDTHSHDASLLPFALAAEQAILERLTLPHDVRHVWVIRCAPLPRQRHLWRNAKVIVLNPGHGTCLERAIQRPVWTKGVINQWFNDYTPDTRDIEINAD